VAIRVRRQHHQPQLAGPRFESWCAKARRNKRERGWEELGALVVHLVRDEGVADSNPATPAST